MTVTGAGVEDGNAIYLRRGGKSFWWTAESADMRQDLSAPDTVAAHDLA